MDFNFQPTIKVNKDSVIEGIDYETPRNNFVTINKVDYIFKKLDENGNKGGNSIILKLYANANIQSQQDYSDLDDIKPDRILKILKFDYKTYKKIPNYKKTHKRFLNEIQALSLCKVPLTLNVIEIFENGSCYIAGNQYLYYTMEFADDDLKSHIEKNHSNLDFSIKLRYCTEILDGINEISRKKLYHRDIKPDNILFVNGNWKIADLGLVDGRQLDYEILDYNIVGPRGWLSPEAMNKYLTENKSFKYKFDILIDSQSDIFQLGKLFWYIFQHNAPIGSVKMSDFKNEFSEIYPILKTMLNHNKKRRYKSINEIIPLFKKIEKKLLLNS